ncbi:hypothetical protein XM38_004880 [Halomicronema hongdechloris C2206]|uniref:DUF4058 domain-containing protein n=1 Tax=Halomicronema hongdechloris C2206 TaxID=1641165 RepID=A0A1Z3HGZ4_9CYAN|nr:DUF4058 family protein [Halomicronema hongdechloris]ASC69561.1 hypothetical protein XM38_004880 [Halomicronema hongdechloris C2206]
MASPFPGMDPYLETPELWSAVHSRLIVAIADELVDHLSQKYRVEVEKRVYFSSEDDSILVGIPDVAVATGRSAAGTTEAATLPPPMQPEPVTVPLAAEVTERYLEIREVATGMVVAVIELLSPKNKRPGEGRIAYLRKRNQVLASVSHLVEIDLLRGGQPLPMSGQHPSDYHILISRADRRPTADLYRFGLQQPIPSFPVPLLPGEKEPILALQPLLNRVYEKGRYHLAIDYGQPPVPPLSKQNEQWMAELLANYQLGATPGNETYD